MNKIIHILFGIKYKKKSIKWACKSAYQDNFILKDGNYNTLKKFKICKCCTEVCDLTPALRIFFMPSVNVDKIVEFLLLQKKNISKNMDPDKYDSELLTDKLDTLTTCLVSKKRQYESNLDEYEPFLKREKRANNLHKHIINRQIKQNKINEIIKK